MGIALAYRTGTGTCASYASISDASSKQATKHIIEARRDGLRLGRQAKISKSGFVKRVSKRVRHAKVLVIHRGWNGSDEWLGFGAWVGW